RILERHARPRHGELGEAVHPPGVFLVHKVRGVEILHLRCDPRGKRGRVELGDGADSRPPLDKPFPEGVDAESERGDRAHSRDDDTSLHQRSPPRDRARSVVLPGRACWAFPCERPSTVPPDSRRHPSFSLMYRTASPTVRIFSASSSGISKSNSSSNAITSSTMSRESAPRSSTKDASSVTSSASTPSCSTTSSLTRSKTSMSSPPCQDSSHGQPAIDDQGVPRDVRCVVADEKCHATRDLFGTPDAPERNPFRQ